MKHLRFIRTGAFHDYSGNLIFFAPLKQVLEIFIVDAKLSVMLRILADSYM
jgi:hypothetical protein